MLHAPITQARAYGGARSPSSRGPARVCTHVRAGLAACALSALRTAERYRIAVWPLYGSA